MDTSKGAEIVKHYSFCIHLINQGTKMGWWVLDRTSFNNPNCPVWIGKEEADNTHFIGFNLYDIGDFKSRIKNINLNKNESISYKAISLLLESFFHDCSKDLSFSKGILIRFYFHYSSTKRLSSPYYERKIE